MEGDGSGRLDLALCRCLQSLASSLEEPCYLPRLTCSIDS